MSKQPEFQNEPRDLVDGIFKRGYILPWELLRIVTWKSSKGLAWLSMNSESEIETYTAELVSQLISSSRFENVIHENLTDADWDEWQDFAGILIGADFRHAKEGVPTGLLRLHGIGYPAATAVLGLLMPMVFPVMDKWAVETIFGAGSSKKRWQHKIAYRTYTARLVEPNCASLEIIDSLRGRDVEAMNAGKEGRKLIGYEPIELPKAPR